MVKDIDFSNETLKQISQLINERKNAFDLLKDNLEGNVKLDYSDIVSRLQVQYFVLDKNRENILTKEEWYNDGFNNTFKVNEAISPITKKNEYSSFALIEPSDDMLLHYPLDDDYISLVGPFAIKDGKEYTQTHLEKELNTIQNKLGIKVVQSGKFSFSKFKQNFIKNAIVKIKNKFLKLCKKEPVQTTYSGKIYLRSNIEGFVPSYVDRVAKIYDYILKVSVSKFAKKYKTKNNKKLPKSIQFASRIYANILMSRVLDLSDVSNNKKLEKCLWLQFANVSNKYCFNSSELKAITKLGLEAAIQTCKDLGITKNKIIAKMTKLDYVYDCVPQNEYEAFLRAKERDYSIYFENANSKNKEQENVNKSSKEENISSFAKKSDESVNTTTKEKLSGEQVLKEIVKVEKTNNSVKESSVAKMVDKAVVNFLATQGTNLAEKINSGKISAKKVELTNAQLNLYNLVLSYYVQASRSKPMSVKNDGNYNENEISKAKLIAKALISERAALISDATSGNFEKEDNQTSRSYINSICKTKTKSTVKEYFTKLIKLSVKHFTEGKKTTITDSEVSDLNYLESKAEELKNVDVPNFVLVDETDSSLNETAADNGYKPNFIIIDENAKEETK